MIPLDLPTANAKGRPIKVILSDRRVVIRVFTVGEEELLMFFGLGLLKPPRIPPNRRPQHFIDNSRDFGHRLLLDMIAADIAAMGDCPLVEGDEHLVKVHVHVFDPGVVISYGVATGFITDVVVENMDDMAQAMRERNAEAVSEDAIADHVAAEPFLNEATIGLVARWTIG